MLKQTLTLLCAATLASAPAATWAKEPKAKASYHVARKIPLAGAVAYHDFLAFDEGARRLWVSHGDEVVVVDPDAGTTVTTLPGFKKVHGIAFAAGRAFVTDGTANLVRAFDAKTGKSVGEAETGKNPDPILYDPASRKIFAFNHSGGGGCSATVIEPATVKVVTTIAFGNKDEREGKAEVGRADGKGTVWVNVEDKNEIVRIDSRKMAVTAHWSIAPCQTPTGLGFDAKHRRLFAGCEENKMMVVVDADTGKVITNVPIGELVDGTEYDPKTGNVYASCSDGTLTIVHQDSADKYSVVQTVATMKSAKTLALDLRKGRVYLSAKVPGPVVPAVPAAHAAPDAAPPAANAPATLEVIVVEP